jgi:hypothetical protein
MISENESFDAMSMPKMHVNPYNKVKGNEGLDDKPLYCTLEVANQQM